MEGFNDTMWPLPMATLPELFEAQVTRNSRAIAIVNRAQSLTFGELNAGPIALPFPDRRWIGPRELDWGLPRSFFRLGDGSLRNMESRRAYLPLDADYPRIRLTGMLADARPALVISTNALRERLPETVEVFALDDAKTKLLLDRQPEYNPTDANRTCSLCRLIRRCHLHLWLDRHSQRGSADPEYALEPHGLASARRGRRVVAQFTFLSFDVSLQEVLHALLAGKTLAIVDAETHLQPDRFADFLRVQGVTDLFVPNIVLEHVARAALESTAGLNINKYLSSRRSFDDHTRGATVHRTPS